MARSVLALAFSIALFPHAAACAEPSLVRQSAFGIEPYITAMQAVPGGTIAYAQVQANLVAYQTDTGATLKEVQRIDCGAPIRGLARIGSILIAPLAVSGVKVFALDAAGKATLVGGGNPVPGHATPLADSATLVLPTEDSLFWLEGYRGKGIGNRELWKSRAARGFNTQALAGGEVIQATGSMEKQAGWFHRIPLSAAGKIDSQAYAGDPISRMAYAKGILYILAGKAFRSYSIRADSLIPIDATTLPEYGWELTVDGEWIGVTDHSAGWMTLLKHASGVFDKAGVKRVPVGFWAMPLSLAGGDAFVSHPGATNPYTLARFQGTTEAESWRPARPANAYPWALVGEFVLMLAPGDKPRIDAVDFRDAAKPAWAGTFAAFEDERYNFEDVASCGEWVFAPNRYGYVYGFKVSLAGKIELAWKHKGKSVEGEGGWQIHPTQVECDSGHLWLGGETETEVFAYANRAVPEPIGSLDPSGAYLAVSSGKIASRGNARSTLANLDAPAEAVDSVALDFDPLHTDMTVLGGRTWFRSQTNVLVEVDALGKSRALPYCGQGSLQYGVYLLGAGCGFDAQAGVPLKAWEPDGFDKATFRWTRGERIYGTNLDGLVLWKDVNAPVGLAKGALKRSPAPRLRRQGLPMRAFLGRK